MGEADGRVGLSRRAGPISGAARPRRARRGGPIFWLVVVVVAALVAALAVAALRPVRDDVTARPNLPAQDFTMSLYQGGSLRLAALRGHTVVVNFWWAGCPPCRDEAGILERASRAWKNKGVVFVGVDTQDDAPTALRFLKDYHVTYPNGPQPGALDIDYVLTGTPETIFISPDGIERVHYKQPFPDDATLSNAIREARA